MQIKDAITNKYYVILRVHCSKMIIIINIYLYNIKHCPTKIYQKEFPVRHPLVL